MKEMYAILAEGGKVTRSKAHSKPPTSSKDENKHESRQKNKSQPPKKDKSPQPDTKDSQNKSKPHPPSQPTSDKKKKIEKRGRKPKSKPDQSSPSSSSSSPSEAPPARPSLTPSHGSQKKASNQHQSYQQQALVDRGPSLRASTQNQTKEISAQNQKLKKIAPIGSKRPPPEKLESKKVEQTAPVVQPQPQQQIVSKKKKFDELESEEEIEPDLGVFAEALKGRVVVVLDKQEFKQFIQVNKYEDNQIHGQPLAYDNLHPDGSNIKLPLNTQTMFALWRPVEIQDLGYGVLLVPISADKLNEGQTHFRILVNKKQINSAKTNISPVQKPKSLPKKMQIIDEKYQNWYDSVRNIELSDKNALNFTFHYVKCIDQVKPNQNIKRTGYILRFNPLSGAAYVWFPLGGFRTQRESLDWVYIKVSHNLLHQSVVSHLTTERFCKIYVDLTKPRIPGQMMKNYDLPQEKGARTTTTDFPLTFQSLQFEFQQTVIFAKETNPHFGYNLKSDGRVPTEEISRHQRCYTCGYIISEYKYTKCGDCQKYFHARCLGNQDKDGPTLHGNHTGISLREKEWKCQNCSRCANCLSTTQPKEMIKCQSCNTQFHFRCLEGYVKAQIPAFGNDFANFPKEIQWKCELCVKCEGCDSRAPGKSKGNKWSKDYKMCSTCNKKRSKKQFCPICERIWCYEQDDEEPMIECTQCRMWIHKGCDCELSDNQFHKYESQGDKRYYCPECRKHQRNQSLDGLIKKLSQLDTNQYFYMPIENLVQGYTNFIKQPMCFEYMVQKVEKDQYLKDPEQLRTDFRLVCTNAMKFNKPTTPYYKEAARLQNEGEKIITKNWKLIQQFMQATQEEEQHRERVREDIKKGVHKKDSYKPERSMVHANRDPERITANSVKAREEPISESDVGSESDSEQGGGGGSTSGVHKYPKRAAKQAAKANKLIKQNKAAPSSLKSSDSHEGQAIGLFQQQLSPHIQQQADTKTFQQEIVQLPQQQILQSAGKFPIEIDDDKSCYHNPIKCCFDDPRLVFEEMCYLCGSFGTKEELLMCNFCGESFHTYCLSLPSNDVSKFQGYWRCQNCKCCEKCQSATQEEFLLYCDVCDKAFHTFCTKPSLVSVPECGWKCHECFECKRCKSKEFITQQFLDTHNVDLSRINYSYSANFNFCIYCGKTEYTRNTCSICKETNFMQVALKDDFIDHPEVTQENVNDNTLVHCAICFQWSHLKCSKATPEDYISNVLKFKQQYKCITCLLVKKSYNEITKENCECYNSIHQIINRHNLLATLLKEILGRYVEPLGEAGLKWIEQFVKQNEEWFRNDHVIEQWLQLLECEVKYDHDILAQQNIQEIENATLAIEDEESKNERSRHSSYQDQTFNNIPQQQAVQKKMPEKVLKGGIAAGLPSGIANPKDPQTMMLLAQQVTDPRDLRKMDIMQSASKKRRKRAYQKKETTYMGIDFPDINESKIKDVIALIEGDVNPGIIKKVAKHGENDAIGQIILDIINKNSSSFLHALRSQPLMLLRLSDYYQKMVNKNLSGQFTITKPLKQNLIQSLWDLNQETLDNRETKRILSKSNSLPSSIKTGESLCSLLASTQSMYDAMLQNDDFKEYVDKQRDIMKSAELDKLQFNQFNMLYKQQQQEEEKFPQTVDTYEIKRKRKIEERNAIMNSDMFKPKYVYKQEWNVDLESLSDPSRMVEKPDSGSGQLKRKQNEHKETFLPKKYSIYNSLYNNTHKVHKQEDPDNIINDIKLPFNQRVDFAREYILKELPAVLRIRRKFHIWVKQKIFSSVKQMKVEMEQVQAKEEEDLPQLIVPIFENDRVANPQSLLPPCSLCEQKGELTLSGRLIPFQYNQWVHANCAVWSDDVLERPHDSNNGGQLINFFYTFRIGRSNKCSNCGRNGATISCAGKKCNNHYHFPCAMQKNCTFTAKREVYCLGCCKNKNIRIPVSEQLQYFNSKRRIYITKHSGFIQNFQMIDAQPQEFVRPYYYDAYNRIGNISLLSLHRGINLLLLKRYQENEAIDFFMPQEEVATMATDFATLRIYWDINDKQTDVSVIKKEKRKVYFLTLGTQPQGRGSQIPSGTTIIFSEQDFEILEKFSSYAIKYRVQEMISDCINEISQKAKQQTQITLDELWNRVMSFQKSDKPNLSLEKLEFSIQELTGIYKYPINKWNQSHLPQNHQLLVSIADSLKHSQGNRNKTEIQLRDLFDRMLNQTKGKESKSYRKTPLGKDNGVKLSKKAQKDDDPMAGTSSAPQGSQTKKKLKSQIFAKDYIESGMERDLPLAMKYRNYENQPKRVVVGPSKIHKNGLFACEDFMVGDIIIEYVGEVVRNKVADMREKHYEMNGMGDCYMFRLDKEYVIDATFKGNKARYLNHSCDASCIAKIVNIRNDKHILMFANKPIKAGEELTYNYHFDIEGEKLECYCGAPNCLGRLN